MSFAIETDAECHARHRALLRESAELAIRAARSATKLIEDAAQEGEPPPPVVSLILVRATTAIRDIITLEQSVMAAQAAPLPQPARGAPAAPNTPAPITPAPRPGPADPRRAPLRDALHKAAARNEPDRAARNQLCRMADELLDAALLEHPDGEIQLGQLLLDVANELGIPILTSKLPDSLLGVPPRRPDPPPEDTG